MSDPKPMISLEPGNGHSLKRDKEERTTAASAEPPPSPAATGMRFTNEMRYPPGQSIRAAARIAKFDGPCGTEEAIGPVTSKIRPQSLSISTESPNFVNETMLSSKWRPSARRPTVWSARLTLARAINSVRGCFAGRIVGLRKHFVQTDLELPPDPLLVFIVRIE